MTPFSEDIGDEGCEGEETTDTEESEGNDHGCGNQKRGITLKKGRKIQYSLVGPKAVVSRWFRKKYIGSCGCNWEFLPADRGSPPKNGLTPLLEISTSL